MMWLDYILLAIVGVMVVLAVREASKRTKGGCCNGGGCSGNCSGCGCGCGKPKKPKEKSEKQNKTEKTAL